MAGPNDVRNYPPTEYGGNAGLVEGDPHVMKAREVISEMARNDDPADPESGVDLAARFESAG
jgi:hypothetical protein